MSEYKDFSEYCSNTSCNRCKIYSINQGYACSETYEEIVKNQGKIIIDISDEIKKEGKADEN